MSSCFDSAVVSSADISPSDYHSLPANLRHHVESFRSSGETQIMAAKVVGSGSHQKTRRRFYSLVDGR